MRESHCHIQPHSCTLPQNQSVLDVRNEYEQEAGRFNCGQHWSTYVAIASFERFKTASLRLLWGTIGILLALVGLRWGGCGVAFTFCRPRIN